MSNTLLSLYHLLPGSLRSAAATLHGIQLKRWRYGSETELLIQQASDREDWDSSKWRAWQSERIRKLLERAVIHVPYYRDYWSRRSKHSGTGAWEDIDNWPILEKETVRANPRAFLADDCASGRMKTEHTSGSTGTPLSLFFSRDTQRRWYALHTARTMRWNGVSREDRWANIGGQLVASFDQKQPPFWVWNLAMRQLYMSSYHLSPSNIPYYLAALNDYKIRYLYGYASSLAILARTALETGWQNLHVRVVVTNAEPLYSRDRTTIEQAFGCPVRETYGMSEVVTAASECEHGVMHMWPEAGYVEVLRGDQPVVAGDAGELVCTGLLNLDMPLIRYRTGDLVKLPDNPPDCACGRLLPRVSSFEGRVDDYVITRDGRSVGRLDTVFKSGLPIQESQVIQEAVDRIRLKLVPAPGYSDATGKEIQARLKQRLGEMHFELECVDQIPPGPNGKRPGVVSLLDSSNKRPMS